MLKRVVDNLEGIPEALHGLYKKEADGKFHLQVEEDPEQKAKLDEFRQNNIKLQKDMKALQDQLSGIDLDEYKELKKNSQALKDKQLLDAGKVDELFSQRTERMRSDHEAQLKALGEQISKITKDYEGVSEKYAKELIEGRIVRAVSAIAVPKKEALADIISRARSTYSLENGELVAKINGKLAYGKDGKTILPIEEFAENLVKDGPHLFEKTSGGGAQGNDGKGTRVLGKIDQAAWDKMSSTEKLKQSREAQGGQKK
jgi:molybdopterin converting factor small subunit